MYFNLLPADIRREHKKEYYFRLATLTASIFAVLIFFGSALFFPSYLLLAAKKDAFESQRDVLEELLKKEGGASLSKDIALVKEEISLMKYGSQNDFYPIVKSIILSKPKSVSINEFSFQSLDSGFSVRIGGLAQSRDSLLAFKSSLLGNRFTKEVDLPVAFLAESKDIEFAINLKGAFVQ